MKSIIQLFYDEGISLIIILYGITVIQDIIFEHNM